MRMMWLSALALGAMTSLALAEPPDVPTSPSWGELTRQAVAAEGGRALGAHAADPNPAEEGNETPRTGLANVTGNRGDLAATIDLISGESLPE